MSSSTRGYSSSSRSYRRRFSRTDSPDYFNDAPKGLTYKQLLILRRIATALVFLGVFITLVGIACVATGYTFWNKCRSLWWEPNAAQREPCPFGSGERINCPGGTGVWQGFMGIAGGAVGLYATNPKRRSKTGFFNYQAVLIIASILYLILMGVSGAFAGIFASYLNHNWWDDQVNRTPDFWLKLVIANVTFDIALLFMAIAYALLGVVSIGMMVQAWGRCCPGDNFINDEEDDEEIYDPKYDRGEYAPMQSVGPLPPKIAPVEEEYQQMKKSPQLYRPVAYGAPGGEVAPPITPVKLPPPAPESTIPLSRERPPEPPQAEEAPPKVALANGEASGGGRAEDSPLERRYSNGRNSGRHSHPRMQRGSSNSSFDSPPASRTGSGRYKKRGQQEPSSSSRPSRRLGGVIRVERNVEVIVD